MNDVEKLLKLKCKFLYPEDKVDTPDIFTFQETKSIPLVERSWNQLLPGTIVYSHGSGHSRGVLLGVHPSSSAQLKNTIHDPEGRFVIAECQLEQELFVVVSVYFKPQLAPEQFTEILSDISQKINHFEQNRVLWMGDFNIALDPVLDTTTIYQHTQLHAVCRKREILHSLMDTHDLSDVWRSIYPKSTRYAVWSTTAGGKVALTRTDLFLTSPAFSTSVVGTSIEPSYCSDHNPLKLNMVIGDKVLNRGYWKFPEFLLNDPSYVASLPEVINYCVRDNSESSPALLWDTVKMSIHGFTIDYLSAAKRKRKMQIESVETAIYCASRMRDAMARMEPDCCSIYM